MAVGQGVHGRVATSPAAGLEAQVGMKLVTVTLNPALDRQYTIPDFSTRGVFRPAGMIVSAGGKGVNVARVWSTLGGKAVATGLLGGRNGEAITGMLAAEGIEARFLPIAGESRLALDVFDPRSGSEAVINEQGPQVAEAEAAGLIDHLSGLLCGADCLCISGSAPPGVPVSIYARMVDLARRQGVFVAVDASGEALLTAIGAGPSLIKPNAEEAGALGVLIATWSEEAPAAAARMREMYALDQAVITGGANGAVVASADGVWIASSPQVRVVSTLGSGDSFMAGFLYGMHEGGGCARALKLGIACGAANAATPGAGHVALAAIEEISGRIVANKVA